MNRVSLKVRNRIQGMSVWNSSKRLPAAGKDTRFKHRKKMKKLT